MPEVIDQGYIDKKKKNTGEYEDLYLEGIELLQKLSSAHWTDFNEHDPGVTILENLSYTLTNLSYKTALPISDILTEGKGKPLQSGDNAFFVPSEVLTTNPVTQSDYRKLVIDQVTNVKNVWFRPNNQVYHNSGSSDRLINNLKGLYHIYIEMYDYDPDPVAQLKEENRIIGEVRKLFHAHRNLCEDVYDIVIFKPFELQLKLKLTLDKTVSGETVFANIYYRINDHLTHNVKFYSLWELQQNGESLDAIFNGPVLENGFIQDSELTQRVDKILPSDVVKIIAQVEGVISVDFFELYYTQSGEGGSETIAVNDTAIEVPKHYAPVLAFPKNNKDLIFKNRGVTFSPDLAEVEKQLSYIQAMNYGSFKSVSQALNTIEIPKGKDLNAAAYYPVREQFPLIYGIGEFGLETGLPPERYAQANQLKAYLLPFDQLMTNFLAQLTQVYDLYDVTNNKIHSYFYQELEDMPELVQLIKNNEFQTKEDALANWKNTLYELNETSDKYAIQRLNEVADNLLARFSEQFPTYALRKINTNCYGKKLTHELFDNNLLSWKRKLIANYGQLSYNRARAYDYKQPIQILEGEKIASLEHHFVPGIIQKIAILMGIKDFSPRSLANEIKTSGIKVYQKNDGLKVISEKLEVIYLEGAGEIIAADDIVIIDEQVENLRDAFYYLGNSSSIIEQVLRNGVKESNYTIKQTNSNKQNSYYVLLTRGGGKTSVVHIAESEEEAKAAIQYVIGFLVELNEKSEGIYLLEHILLAPPFHGNHFGFEFQLPLNETQNISFKHIALKSNGHRNLDVNHLIQNLNTQGTLQFKVISVNFQYVIQILSKDGTQLATTSATYVEKSAAQKDKERLLQQLEKIEEEIILNSLAYYAYYNEEDRVNEAFFSFKMSFLMPSWPVRFQNKNFRIKFENIIYEHAPVHIAFHSYWLGIPQMGDFESVYYKWVTLIANNDYAQEQMEYAYQLIQLIQGYQKEQVPT